MANTLLGIAAAVGSTVLLPVMKGETYIPVGLFVAVVSVAAVCLVVAAGFRYITEEREGEEHRR
jgi:hypothetical protein